MHLHIAWPRSAPEPARHANPDAMTSLPNPLVHYIDAAAHQFSCLVSEPDPFPRETAIHRHHLSVPWNQLTVPPRTTAHDDQW
jgi:hypothetical protein